MADVNDCSPQNFKSSIFVHLFLRVYVTFGEHIEPPSLSFFEFLLVNGKDMKLGTFP